MHKGNTLLKVISLLAAIVLWLYVMGEVDPESRAKIGDIPVSLVNTEVLEDYGIAAVYDEQTFISATVSGKQSDVNEAKKNGLTAYVDVAECEYGSNEERIVINLPDGISLENSSQSTMNIKVKNLVSETKPVVIEFSDMDTTNESVSDTVPWVLDQYPEEVTVSGAESSVDKVKEVKGFIAADEAVKGKSKWVDVSLLPVNGKGRTIHGLGLSTDSAEAEIQKLYVGTVKLQLTAEDSEEDIDIDNIGAPDNIKIVGLKSAIKKIDVIEGVVTVDENGKANIRLDLPENIFLLIGEDKWEDYLELME